MEARDAVGALARHVVLKVPDKADFRALAASAAAELVAELPTAHQHTFVVFITRLSRTPKVGLNISTWGRIIVIHFAGGLAWNRLNGCTAPADLCNGIDDNVDVEII